MILQKTITNKPLANYSIFMAVAEKCGHDRRGRELPIDDISTIAQLFHKWAKENKFSF